MVFQQSSTIKSCFPLVNVSLTLIFSMTHTSNLSLSSHFTKTYHTQIHNIIFAYWFYHKVIMHQCSFFLQRFSSSRFALFNWKEKCLILICINHKNPIDTCCIRHFLHHECLIYVKPGVHNNKITRLDN